jgi:putative ABC transport system permease protein
VIESSWLRLRHFWRPNVRDDVNDEVSFHIAMRVDQFVAAGMTPDDAVRAARAQFGDLGDVSATLVSIGARRRRRLDFGESANAVLTDIRHAARSLRTHSAFSLTCIATLALGIGASTAIFSVVNAVLIRPLPYGEPDRLGVITDDLRSRGSLNGPITPGDFPDIRAGATLFQGIAGFVTVIDQPFDRVGGHPEPIVYVVATPNIFDVLKVPVVHGRNFTADDGRPDAPIRAVPLDSAARERILRQRLPRIGILGYAFWQRQFGADSTVIGRTIAVAESPIQIVGIASPKAEILWPVPSREERFPDLWVAQRINFNEASRQNGLYRVLARMKPGVSIASARSQIDEIGADLRGRFPLRKSAAAYLRFEPMKDYLVGKSRPAILTLLGAVGFLLLISCANVANLTLVRAAQRDRELAVRVALGGSPWRIIRQFLAESIFLATLGAVVGIGIAKLGITLLARLAPPDLPRLSDVSMDGTVLLFTLALTFAAVILSGLVPALRVCRPQAAEVLRTSGRASPIHKAARFRSTIVIVEVALSFVLLIGCGLMIRSFATLVRTDLGFDPNGLLTFTLTNRIFHSVDERNAFARQIHDRLVSVPGVTGVTAATSLPLDGARPNGRWGTKAALADSNLFRQAGYQTVLPGYFETMGTALVAGRTFTDADNVVDQKLIVIDDEAARLSFGDTPAIGQTLVVRHQTETNEEFTVIGVVRRERRTTLAGAELPVIYFPEVTTHGIGRWAVRTSGDPAAIGSSVRAAIASVNPELIVNHLQPMSVFVDKAMAPTRFVLILIGIFAAIAALLAASGLYGVLSSTVRQRTPEIGIRMTFGAESSNIFALVIGQGLKLSGIGLAIGIVIALGSARVMASMLVGVRPTDPTTFAAMTAVLLTVAFVACWLPARRAARLDPSVALREDAM